LRSDAYTWSDVDIANATLDEAIDEVADHLELVGIDVRDSYGKITSEARRLILSELKKDTRYSSLMKSDNKTVSSLSKSNRLMQDVINKLQKGEKAVSSYADILEIFTDETDENIQK
jgi:hypothetical protein